MITSKQIGSLVENLKQLGPRRLAILGAVGLIVMATLGVSVHRLSRPAMQPIYTGLSPQDVSRMASALSEAGIAFDMNEPRTSIMVPFGQAMKARVLLAQKGLPTSSRAGYELFDQMGSMGLTSFMQEVTRARALEGEIARTIQTLEGVSAARVHLVLADQGSFRREQREATASVLLRLDSNWLAAAGPTVRHIVAAAVPGLKLENVSVASTDGRMIVAGGDEQSLGSMRLAEMERAMALELEQKAGRTLATALGNGHFQISITVRLDVDRQQISETIFDPASRSERSMRVVRQSGSSEEGNAKTAVGVEANLPRAELKPADAEKRTQREDRREELINYELSSKTVQTVREGYRVRRIAIAVVVNRRQIAAQLGAAADAAAEAARLDELKRLIAAATGADASLDSTIEISAAEFGDADAALAGAEGTSVLDLIFLHLGSIVNAIALLATALIVLLVGVRPLVRALARPALPDRPMEALANTSAAAASLPAADAPADGPPRLPGSPARPAEGDRSNARPADADIRTRLEAIVAADDAKAAKVLKTWMAEASEGR